MRVREIGHVHVVTKASAVRCWIVLTEDLEWRPAKCRVERSRDYVHLRHVILTELTVGIGARSIEVPQSYRADSISALEVREGMLDSEFCLPIRIDRRGRVRFYKWNLGRFTVDRTRRRKYKMPAALGTHRLERGQCPSDVVLIVGRRVAH